MAHGGGPYVKQYSKFTLAVGYYEEGTNVYVFDVNDVTHENSYIQLLAPLCAFLLLKVSR